MLDKLVENIGKIWKSEGQEEILTPKDFSIRFELKYQSSTIGYLSLKDGVWTFEYSQAFKKQTTLKPLTDFPDVNKVYSNKELYPFFIQRIPGINQPKVQQVIEREKIDKTNEAELLKRFGEYSISNPFRLLAVA